MYDVVIAGAGPVGLFLACELRLAGRSVLVLERAGDPCSPLKQLPFGLRGLSMPTLDALHRRGLLDAVAAQPDAKDGAQGDNAPAVPHWMRPSRRPGGHFAGIPFHLDTVDTSQWSYHRAGPGGTSLPVEMQHLETVLATRAKAMGAKIRRGLGVDDLEPSDSGVTVRAGTETVRARWLVGCDGGRSTVRRLAGFGFVGTDPEFTGYSADIEMADPDALAPGRHYTPSGMYTYSPPGMVAMVEYDGGAFHRVQPITRDHVQAVLRRVSGVNVTLTALRIATTWTDRAHQATDYRQGRVLLAGDAAHIHSPLGGQGLNLGLGDALNLGWKLAAKIRGDAPAGLLDTYMAERHPVGARVLQWSRAQVALMRPSPSSRALEAIVRDLIETRDGATYFAERVWGAGLRYDLGGRHPLIGRSLPELALRDGTSAGRHLAAGQGFLLNFEDQPSLRTLADRWCDRIAHVPTDTDDRIGLRAVLARPDGIVIWVAEADDDHDGAEAAMLRWFGAPGTLKPSEAGG